MASNDTRFWDRVSRKYAATKIADPQGYERTIERTRQHLKPADAVVEFGCGTGTTALRLASAAARYVATDISPAMIEIAREKAQAEGVSGVEFAVATLAAPPWPDASFDAALAFNLLHLVPDRAGAMARIRALLKPGGLFISKTPCLGEANPIYRVLVPMMQMFGQAPYVAFFTAAELEADVAAAGFDIAVRERHASRGKDPRPFLVARKR